MSHYLPVLLVSVSTNAIPDDSALTILPRAQVDYLSHNWREEDVWRSWRNMTRQKNEIANGMRLENASWRTWWKQRNKLKTVTPEKLNWLKDSDVTWLYGPLHTDSDWTPPPKPLPPAPGIPNSAHDRLDFTAKKPILKHRSISELLTSDLPSPLFSPAESENEEASAFYSHDGPMPSRKRPALLHTKSDTYITRWGPNRAFRKDSPPRVPPSEPSSHPLPYSDSNPNLGSYFHCNASTSGSTCSSVPSQGNLGPGSDNGRDTSPSSVIGSHGVPKKKHISFNTFVQQCIAIEKPKKINSFSQSWYGDGDDDGYDEDEEDGYDDDDRWEAHRPHSDHDSGSDGEDEDDVLEMCTPSTLKLKARSKSKASSSSSSSASPSAPRRRPSIRRTVSSDREHVTIAPIAPTILKTTGASGRTAWGDSFGDDYNCSDDNDGRWYSNEHRRTSSSEGTPVELVYVPPLGSPYHLHAEPESMYSPTAPHYEDDDTFVLPPHAAAAASRAHAQARPAVQTGDREEFESAYDYFAGPDLGDDFSRNRIASSRAREAGGRGRTDVVTVPSDDVAQTKGGRNVLRFAQGGAASVTGGRSPVQLPELVLNGGSGAIIDSSSSTDIQVRTRTVGSDHTTCSPSPIDLSASDSTIVPISSRADSYPASQVPLHPVPVPPRLGHLHPRSASYSPPPALLPPPTRGRAGLPKSASALALGAEADQERGRGRGRSSTRSSPSVSDRERDRFNGSPMGSLSPEGLGGLGGAHGYGYAGGRLDREREREKEKDRDRERPGDRGRERTARRVGASPSPDGDSAAGANVVISRSRESSTPSAASAKANSRPPGLDLVKDRPTSVALNAATSQEAELHRSWNPTPVNSPVKDVFGKSPFSTTSPPVSPTTKTSPMSITATAMNPSSPRPKVHSPIGALPSLRGAGKQGHNPEMHFENGTLVSRAVGIVSSAGVYLGLWHNPVV